MAPSGDPPSFEDWLARLYDAGEVPDDEVNAPVLRWLRGYFDVEGPVPAKTVRDAVLLAYQIALANDAAAAVLDDLHRTTAAQLVVVVEEHDGSGVRISINGGWTAPSMWELERPAAFAEVADYIQEQLWDRGRRPVCDQHDIGLHGEVHEGAPVWWCRFGAHPVARIGELGL